MRDYPTQFKIRLDTCSKSTPKVKIRLDPTFSTYADRLKPTIFRPVLMNYLYFSFQFIFYSLSLLIASLIAALYRGKFTTVVFLLYFQVRRFRF